MCKLRTCCFCLSLRTGSIISAIYTLVLAVFATCNSIAAVVQAEKNDMKIVGKIALWVTLAIYILWFIFGIVLLLGIRRSRRGYLMPWIVLTAILTAISILTMVLALAGFKTYFKTPSAVLQFCIWISSVVINIICLMCVHSYYHWNCKEPGQPGGPVSANA